jgi:hypothetical protein
VGCDGQCLGLTADGKLVVAPPLPNVVSGVPLALSRSMPKLVGVVFSYPAMMICPGRPDIGGLP